MIAPRRIGRLNWLLVRFNIWLLDRCAGDAQSQASRYAIIAPARSTQYRLEARKYRDQAACLRRKLDQVGALR